MVKKNMKYDSIIRERCIKATFRTKYNRQAVLGHASKLANNENVSDVFIQQIDEGRSLKIVRTKIKKGI